MIKLQWGRALKGAEGDAVPMPSIIANAMLQWGRGHRATETTTAAASTINVTILQWGRALKGAEGVAPPRIIVPIPMLQWSRAPTGTEGLHWQAAMQAP